MFDGIISKIAGRVEKSATAKRALMNTLRKTFGDCQILILDFRTDELDKMIEELPAHPKEEVQKIKDYYFQENKRLKETIKELRNQIKMLDK